MKSYTRTIFLSAVGISAALALAGCSLLSPAVLGPPRDADGRVTEPAEINSSQLLVGDCFSFVEGTNMATVVPCSVEHTHIVISDGDLDDAAIAEAGGLQNAVNAACDEPFAEFKAAAAEGVKPEQQFLVSEFERDDVTLTKYSCVATDAVGTALE